MIIFLCPDCRSRFEVDDTLAGQKAKCFNCKTRFIVPMPVEYVALKIEHSCSASSQEGLINPIEVHVPAPPVQPVSAGDQFKLRMKTVEQAPKSEAIPETELTLEPEKTSATNMRTNLQAAKGTAENPETSGDHKTLRGENKMIKFLCPECQSRFEVGDAFAGKPIECSKCKTNFIAPSLSEGDCANKIHNWYYIEDNHKHGPVMEEVILELLSSGVLTSETMVWSKGLNEWTAVSNVSALMKDSDEPPPLPKQNASSGSLLYHCNSSNCVTSKTDFRVRPWVRFWARVIDCLLLYCIGSILFIALSPVWPVWLLAIWLLAGYLFIEAFMISVLGATPGKALLRVKIRREDGTKLSFINSLYRAFRVWWQGEGLCLPPICFMTNLLAYNSLKQNGKTPWDSDGKFTVSHQAIGLFRIIAVVPFLLAVVLVCLTMNWGFLLSFLPRTEHTPEEAKAATLAEQYRKVAEQGYAEAQYNLAMCYASGAGVTQDFFESAKWLRKAADQNLAVAQYALGDCYANGYGVMKDNDEAATWFSKAAEQGNPPAKLRKGAEKGDAIEQYNLGVCYYNGTGVVKNQNEWIKWWSKAAEQGFAEAQLGMGDAYSEGRGVEESKEEALKWYRKAAEQGNADGQFNTALIISTDPNESVKWLRKAADQGFAMAQNVLGDCYAKGTGVTQDFADAAKWYRKAAEQFRRAAEQGEEERAFGRKFFSILSSLKGFDPKKDCRKKAKECDDAADAAMEKLK